MARTIGTAGRTHAMGTGIEVTSVRVELNGQGFRRIMKSDGAQELVNERAQGVCDTANSTHRTYGARYVVHPRVLEVSAHAFVDPDNYAARLDEHYHQTLDKAFWASAGG